MWTFFWMHWPEKKMKHHGIMLTLKVLFTSSFVHSEVSQRERKNENQMQREFAQQQSMIVPVIWMNERSSLVITNCKQFNSIWFISDIWSNLHSNNTYKASESHGFDMGFLCMNLWTFALIALTKWIFWTLQSQISFLLISTNHFVNATILWVIWCLFIMIAHYHIGSVFAQNSLWNRKRFGNNSYLIHWFEIVNYLP